MSDVTINGRKRNQLSRNDVNKLFQYEDGVLYWRHTPSSAVDITKPAGSIVKNSLYCNIKINGVYYRRHVLIWNMFNDKILDNDITIDHILSLKCGGSDKIENLRLVTMSINNQNKIARNASGYTSIRKIERNLVKPWQVNLPNLKISKYFETLEDAIVYRNKVRFENGMEPAKDKVVSI